MRFPTKFTASDNTTTLAVDVHVAQEPTDHDPFADSIISMAEEGDVVCLPTIPDGKEQSGNEFTLPQRGEVVCMNCYFVCCWFFFSFFRCLSFGYYLLC